MACAASAESTLGTTTAAGPATAARMSSSCQGAEPVDPDGHLPAAVAAGSSLAHLVAGLRLGVGGDGVLEVENEGVGGQAGLLQRPLVGAGHVEDRAAGSEAASALVSPIAQPAAGVERGVLGVGLARPGSLAASASASSTMTRHCLTDASSSIFPSIMRAPVPSPMAAMTRRAWRTSSGAARTPGGRCRSGRVEAPGAHAAEQEGVAELVLAGRRVLDVAEGAVVRQDPRRRSVDHASDGVVPQVLLERRAVGLDVAAGGSWRTR